MFFLNMYRYTSNYCIPYKFWFCTPQKIPNPKWNDGKACSVPTSTNAIKVTCILCREHVFHLVTNALSWGYRQTILSGTWISIKHSTGCWLNCNEIIFHFVNGLFKKNYLHVYRYYLFIFFFFIRKLILIVL